MGFATETVQLVTVLVLAVMTLPFLKNFSHLEHSFAKGEVFKGEMS